MATLARRRCPCAGRARTKSRNSRRILRRRRPHARDAGNSRGRENRCEALRNAGFQVEPFRPEGLEEARVLWKKFFVIAGGMLIRPMFRGREHELSPMLKQFLDWSAARAAAHRRDAARCLDRPRHFAREISCADAEVSHSAVPRGCDSRVSARRAQLENRRQNRRSISMPGVIPNGSICWAIRRLWFR